MEIKNILGFLGLITIIVFYFWQSEIIKSVKSEGLKTICVIESYGDNVICRYKIDDKLFEFKESQPYSGLQSGERYEISYLPENKERAVVLYENFIIPDSLMFLETNSINANEQFVSSNRIKFSYSVDGKIYTRYQKYKIGEKIDEGKIYVVKYDPNNPRIAYLIFE